MLDYNKFILEHKLWGKTIIELLSWLELKSNKYWCIYDSETTGLRESPYEVQLTQVSCIIVKWNPIDNKFDEIDTYNKKVKLSQKTIDMMKSNDNIKKVLSFNHYGEISEKYDSEESVLKEFHDFIDKYNNPILVIQNAIFDMFFLNTRNKLIKFKNEVIDTKQIIQLFYLPTILKLAETSNFYKSLISKIGISDRDNGLISSSMSKIGPALDINMGGYHDALFDCRITIEMLSKIIFFLRDNRYVDIKKYQADRIKIKR